jgi:hypothetical protein
LTSASAALVWSAHPTWTANQVLRVLLNTASKPTDGAERNDAIGYGAVRPRVALQTPGDPGPADVYPLAEHEGWKQGADVSATPTKGAEGSGAPAPSASAATSPSASDSGSGGGSSTPWIAAGAAVVVLAAGGTALAVRGRRRRAAAAAAPAFVAQPLQPQHPPQQPPPYGGYRPPPPPPPY